MSTTSEQGQQHSSHSSQASSLSPSNSISLIKVDELSSFGATKQQRLPALIKLNPLADQQQQQSHLNLEANSLPDFSGSQAEKMAPNGNNNSNKQAESLPAGLPVSAANKENASSSMASSRSASLIGDALDDFQVVNMDEAEAAIERSESIPKTTTANEPVGPSLPAPTGLKSIGESLLRGLEADSLSAQLLSTNLATGQYASHLGDSLIEMIINLRNENQNLVRALETNNEYVKERLSEFKRCQEEAKRRDAQHAREKAEFEHQARKLKRQNEVLSERLKSLEGKLSEMNIEVSQSLEAAHSSKASSINNGLYPQLGASNEESFSNAALMSDAGGLTTMQMDATSGELYNQGDQQQQQASGSGAADAQMDTSQGNGETASKLTEAMRVGQMSSEELGKRFDADKSAFYALDDPMKQCDQLEQQLNDIGRRDYEICLLQQQLNIYRQDFRLERMAKLEARIQIEKLKNDIDRLCLDRLQEQRGVEQPAPHGVHFAPPGTSEQGGNLIGKLGHHLGRKAVKSAAKAAKYAAKQAHLEEKAAAALARAAAAKAAAASHFSPMSTTTTANDLSGHQQSGTTQQATGESNSDPSGRGHHHHGHHHGRHHGRHHRGASTGGGRPAGIRSEVMNDLLSTANKAMLTGYKMASTHVNLALDKLSQYEQQQASQLDPSNRTPIQTAKQPPPTAAANTSGPSAPPMEPPSID